MDSVRRWVTTWEFLALDCSWDMRRCVWLFVSKPEGFQEGLQGLFDEFSDGDRFRNPDLIHDRALRLATDTFSENDMTTLRRWVEIVCAADADDRLDEGQAFRSAALLAHRYAELVEDSGLRDILPTVIHRWNQLIERIYDGLNASMSAVLDNSWQRERIAKPEAWTFGEEEVGGFIEGLSQFNSFVEAVDVVMPELTDEQIHKLAELQPAVLLKAFGHSPGAVITWRQLVDRHRYFLNLIPTEEG